MKHVPDARLSKLSSFNLVLAVLWGECRGEPVEGQIAVANVIKNRLDSGRWGHSYHAVILAWAQFSCLWPQLDERSFAQVLDFTKRIERVELFTPAERQLYWITQGVFSGSFKDNTHGALHYHADYVNPFWAKAPGALVTAHYGRHIFYRGIR